MRKANTVVLQPRTLLIVLKKLRLRALHLTRLADHPFVATEGDPAFVKRRKKINEEKSTKVLTKIKQWRILRIVIKRKDDKVATKSKTQTKFMQIGAISLLAAGAILGFADQLGGGLRACVAAVLLASVLFAHAIDYRK